MVESEGDYNVLQTQWPTSLQLKNPMFTSSMFCVKLMDPPHTQILASMKIQIRNPQYTYECNQQFLALTLMHRIF